MGVYGTALDYTAYASASYTQQLPWDITGGLSFSYYFADHTSASNTGDRWQADVSFSRQIWDNVSGSISLGYGKDQAAETTVCCVNNQNGFQAFVRLAWTPDAHTNAFASYDTRSQTGQVTYTQTSETLGVGSWTATATAETQPGDQTAISASATYMANRAEVSVSHTAGLSGVGYSGFNPASTQEQTSVGVAHKPRLCGWGLGHRPPCHRTDSRSSRPTNRWMAAPSLSGRQDSTIAETDWLGAAVVPTATPYRQARAHLRCAGRAHGLRSWQRGLRYESALQGRL